MNIKKCIVGLADWVSELGKPFKIQNSKKNHFSRLGFLENLETREVLSASVTGQVAFISAPSTVEVNMLEDNTKVKFFAEQQNVTLANPITVDASKIGNYSNETTFKPATLLAGTKVNSYYLHSDRIGNPAVFRQFIGSVKFDETILGVVSTRDNLNVTDSLGSVTTTYPTSGRCLDATDKLNPDIFTISLDRKTLSFNFLTANFSDDIRIITSTNQLNDIDVEKVFLKIPDVSTNKCTLAINAPQTVEVNTIENDDYAMLFVEKTNFNLTSALKVDASKAGEYKINSGLTPATLQAGTKINSYYLHADRVGTNLTPDPISGSITFDAPILGVITTRTNLNNSDTLGSDSTIYPKGARVFDANNPAFIDKFWISADLKTLRYELFTSTDSDDLRIITGVATIPSVPLDVKVSSTLPGVANLDWKAPAFDGFSTITKYLVEYSADGGRTWLQVSTTNPACLQISISGLISGMDYGFRVSANNAKGNSLYSSPIYARIS